MDKTATGIIETLAERRTRLLCEAFKKNIIDVALRLAIKDDASNVLEQHVIEAARLILWKPDGYTNPELNDQICMY